jgi:hypothetical protein
MRIAHWSGCLRFLFAGLLVFLAASPDTVWAATTVQSFSISGTPISNSSQTATGTVTINRDPNDTGDDGVSFEFFFLSGSNVTIKFTCDTAQGVRAVPEEAAQFSRARIQREFIFQA